MPKKSEKKSVKAAILSYLSKMLRMRSELNWTIRGLDAYGGFWYNFTRSPQK